MAGPEKLIARSIVGQNPYESRVSGKTEYFPIVASIAGAQGTCKTDTKPWHMLNTPSPPGSNLMLLHVAAKALEKAG